MKVNQEPHEYTREETRQLFLEKIWTLVDYWDKEDRPKTKREALQGLAFSILSTLDGSGVGLPPFAVVPLPCSEDKAYHKENGEPWFPLPQKNGPKNDIGGCLHEHYYDVGREMGLAKGKD
jgi:hypothetical protein